MKLHSITLHNIKSLNGTFILNLDERFGDSELFLIHGPTGVGKTSIFDAVALSLFGQTPKLNGGAQGEGSNSVSWVMNELSGYCWTELVFSILEPSGGRVFYQARWELHKSGRRPQGAIQQVRRMLNKLDHNYQFIDVLVDSKIAREYNAVFETALYGMTYEDFQQTVLLPQNGFAHFIEADQQERTILLERLTGTGHLAELCSRADDRRKRCRENRKNQESLLLGVLSETEIATTKHTLELKKKELSDFSVVQKVLVIGQNWNNHVEMSEQQEQIRKANSMATQELNLDIQQDSKALETLINEGASLEQDLENLRENRGVLDIALNEILQSVSILIKKREELTNIRNRVEQRSKEIRRIEQKMSRMVGVSSEEMLQAENQQKSALLDLNNHLSDATLDDYVTKITNRKKVLNYQVQILGSFVSLSHRQSQLNESIKSLQQEIERDSNSIISNEHEMTGIDKEVTNAKVLLDTLNTRLEKAREFFVWHLERTKLEEGKPCVLCGSEHHPFIRHAMPEKYEAAKRKQQAIEVQYQDTLKNIERFNLRVVELQTRIRIKNNTRQRTQKNLDTMNRNWQEQKNQMALFSMDIIQSEDGLNPMKALDIKEKVEFENDQLDVQMNTLTTAQIQLTRLLQAQTKQQELINQKQTLLLQQDEDSRQVRVVEQEINEGAAEEQTNIAEITMKINQLTKSNCAQKQKLSEMIHVLQLHIVTVLENWNRQYTDWTNRRTRLRTAILTKNESLDRRTQEFQEIVQHQQILTDQTEVLKNDLQVGLRSMEGLPRQMFEADGTWREMWKSLNDSRTSVFERIATCEQTIQTLVAQIQRYDENIDRMKRIEHLRQEEQQWSDMHLLLNTNRHVVKDPKGGMSVNFRKYAQIRQLQLLVEGANEHLSAMQTEYFITIRKDGDGRPMLDFELKMDSQFSRPLTTLSGGQTFIVSLAFALALADLRKVDLQIETLLIDEGFGSLDRNYVEMAVDTLGQLKHKGVQVGLISHVGALQEKIPASVTIEDLEIRERI